MSNLTLSPAILNALLAPVGTHMPAPASPGLLDFAKSVNMLADAGMLEQVIREATPVQVKPAPKPARKAKAVKSSPILVRTKNGGNMDSRPGTITTSGKDGGQLGKLIKLGVAMGEPFTATEIKAMRTWSMATASNYRYDLING